MADSWTYETAKIFFEWTKNLRTDLIESLSSSDDDFRVTIENAFGEAAVKKSWGEKYKDSKKTTIITSNNVAKPWRQR